MSETRFYLYKLHFKGSLHLSRGNEGDLSSSARTLHSDTLYAALYAVAKQHLPNVAEYPDFAAQFTLSSCYPFIEKLVFFPRPFAAQNWQVPDDDPQFSAKKIKKVAYFSKGLFERVIHGESIEIKECVFLNGGDMLATESEMKNLGSFFCMRNAVEQKVQVSLTGNTDDGQTYYVDKIFFYPQAGLYFLVQFNTPEFKKTFDFLIKLLGEAGIGSDRTVGNGQFDCSIEELTMQLPEHVKSYVNLSLWLPSLESNQLNQVFSQSAYRLLKRGGYIASAQDLQHRSLRKKEIYMVGEGSALKLPASPEGSIVNLAPDEFENNHPVYRDGRAIFIPLKTI